MGLFTSIPWIFSARTLDRLGKGVRTAARDAMLSDQSTPESKARVFGFHRSMDTFGAVLGPSIALIYLYYFPSDYRMLFFIAFIPGLLSIAATFFLREDTSDVGKVSLSKTSFFSFLNYWKQAPAEYRSLIIGLTTFTLFNSSDVFLLLKAKESGLSDTVIIEVYIFYNLIYALMAFPAGILADKLGIKNMFVLGLIFFSITYYGMTIATDTAIFAAVFFSYGLYAAFTEGISKAWVANLVDKKDTATAIGMFTSFQSIATLLASSIAGIVWHRFGASATFMLTASISVLLIFYFAFVVKAPLKGGSHN
jgi:MFS family permease